MTRITGQRYVLAVADLDRSVRFYRDVLGFQVVFETDGWCFLGRDACMLMLGECPDALPASELGDHSYFAYLEVEGIDALFDQVHAAGAEVVAPLGDRPWGMREFGLRTVDGHRIMLGQELG